MANGHDAYQNNPKNGSEGCMLVVRSFLEKFQILFFFHTCDFDPSLTSFLLLFRYCQVQISDFSLVMASSTGCSEDLKTSRVTPFVTDWGKAPFSGPSDAFWEQVRTYDSTTFPSPEKEGLFLYVAACGGWDDFPHSGRIPRMCIEKQEYLFNPSCFLSDSSGRLLGWQHLAVDTWKFAREC